MRKPLLVLLVCACSPEINVTDTPRAKMDPAPAKYTGQAAPLTSPCDFDASAARGVLVATSQREAFLVRSDGAQVPLVSSTWVGAPMTRGAFITVVSTRLEDGQYTSRVHLFHSSGVELGLIEGASDPRLSADGVVAASTANGVTVLRPDGSTFEEPGLTVAGDLGPGGLLPVWKKDTAGQLALLDVQSRRVEALEPAVFGWASPIWSGDVLVFLGQRDGQPLVVRRQNGLTLTTPIAATLIGGLEIEQVTGDAAVLVSGAWVQVRTRVDLKTGEATPLEVELPQGLAFAGRHSATLADDGSLVAALQQGGAAGLFRSLDGKSWSPLGGGVKDATFVQFAGRGGSWLMTAMGGLGGASSTTVGVIPSMQRAVTLPAMVNVAPTQEALSLDGRCAAVWTGSGTSFSLVATDLVRGTERTLASSSVRPTSAVWLR